MRIVFGNCLKSTARLLALPADCSFRVSDPCRREIAQTTQSAAHQRTLNGSDECLCTIIHTHICVRNVLTVFSECTGCRTLIYCVEFTIYLAHISAPNRTDNTNRAPKFLKRLSERKCKLGIIGK